MKYLRSLSSRVYRFISVHGADGREAKLHGGGGGGSRKSQPIGAECQKSALARECDFVSAVVGGGLAFSAFFLEGRRIVSRDLRFVKGLLLSR